jgi:hypothetical protein
MAIIQISKIQQRAGNLVDLPQLDNAEFGWATDENRLFIGRTGNTVSNENIEVLTSYSNISFSQIDGSNGGNFNITSANNGQILTYVSSTDTWENFTGKTQLGGGKLQLTNVSNIQIDGGAIGYVLQTDGIGNLSWTPKGALYTPILSLTNNPTGNIITMHVANTTPYTNNATVTISGVQGSNAVPVNGKSFYIRLDANFSANSNVVGSGNVILYDIANILATANGAGLTANANTGIATSLTGGTGGGGGAAGGTTTTVQYNDSGVLAGSSGFTYSNNTVTVNGNVNSSNLNATSTITGQVLVSNITTGTAPLTVTSTTRVSNLSVAYANVSDYEVVTTQTTGTFYPTFVNANTTGNLALGSNANLSFTAANGRLSATLLGGTLTTAAQPNITSVGTLTTLSVSGNANIGNIGTAGIITATGNANVGNIGANNAVFTLITGTLVTGAQPNITSTGTLSSLSVTGNANIGNIGTGGLITATGNITGGNIITSGLVSATGNGTFGNVSATLFTGNLSGTGNSNVGNLGVSGLITAVGNITGANLSASNNITGGNLSVSGNIIGGNIYGLVRPTSGSGTAGVSFYPENPGGGSGDAATIKYYAVTGETCVMEFSVTNDPDDTIRLNATGGTTVINTLTAGNLATAGNLSVGGNTTLGNLLTTNISTGANTTPGSLTGNWTLTSGSRLQATYADLAEYYEADQDYEPGTVLEFGGEKEVTLASDGTSRVAGVVSTNPAYAMNANCQGVAVAIALQGRVPTKVRGIIHKGDMMVSGGNGFARPCTSPQMGTVIGKALENFDGIEGIIEVAVGRL